MRDLFSRASQVFKVGAVNVATNWLDNLRWTELGAAIAATYEGMYQLAQVLKVSPDAAHILALCAAIGAAILYLRNPKHSKWVQSPEEKND